MRVRSSPTTITTTTALLRKRVRIIGTRPTTCDKIQHRCKPDRRLRRRNVNHDPNRKRAENLRLRRNGSRVRRNRTRKRAALPTKGMGTTRNRPKAVRSNLESRLELHRSSRFLLNQNLVAANALRSKDGFFPITTSDMSAAVMGASRMPFR